MLAHHTENESTSKERLRDFIINDVSRKERIRTQESELIVIEESRQQRQSGEGKKAVADDGK